MATVHLFPKEVLIHIFSHLDRKNLQKCALVSQSWKVTSQENRLWYKHYKDRLQELTPYSPEIQYRELFIQKVFPKPEYRASDPFTCIKNAYDVDDACKNGGFRSFGCVYIVGWVLLLPFAIPIAIYEGYSALKHRLSPIGRCNCRACTERKNI